jgi:hypothetical protein
MKLPKEIGNKKMGDLTPEEMKLVEKSLNPYTFDYDQDFDKLSNQERMKIAITWVRGYRYYNCEPTINNTKDIASMWAQTMLMNDMRKKGFSDEEIKYAIARVYNRKKYRN